MLMMSCRRYVDTWKQKAIEGEIYGGPAGIRTRETRLRRPVPYPLSHGPLKKVIIPAYIKVAVIK